MTNVHEKILEILCNFVERVHDSGRVPQNKLEFLKFCNKPRNVMKNLYFKVLELSYLTLLNNNKRI